MSSIRVLTQQQAAILHPLLKQMAATEMEWAKALVLLDVNPEEIEKANLTGDQPHFVMRDDEVGAEDAPDIGAEEA